MSRTMKRMHRKWLIVLVLLALGAIAWWADLFTVGDCLMQGGRWNWDGHFCRLDSIAHTP
ncbi:hypothetical protein SAMN02927924_02202 [Sphingobium faniae]|nr:hypothetical protein SAMN02927924_02202 [Sphingobium faniae]